MSLTKNRYCEVLGIAVPRLESIVAHREANYFGMLVVALLQQGGALTLGEVAERIARAGVGAPEAVLASLRRCKPARPPVYRSGELYELDPHDRETDMWAFRLDLRPPKRAPDVPTPSPPPREPISDDVPLLEAELAIVMKSFRPSGWSDLRVAMCVLDVHGERMELPEFLKVLEARDGSWRLFARSAKYWHAGHAVRLEGNGWLSLDRSHPHLRASRGALRKRIAELEHQKFPIFDPVAHDAATGRRDGEHEAEGARLVRQPRVIVHGFPAHAPRDVILLDVHERHIVAFGESERDRLRLALSAYDAIAGLDVRDLMRALEFDPEERRLGELRPSSKRITRGGGSRRTVAVTPDLALRGSCGLRQALASDAALARAAGHRDPGRLRTLLTADAKLLFALYEYGRLHHQTYLAVGQELASVPAPWVLFDEPDLLMLMRKAVQMRQPLEVVLGRFPDWDSPDARGELAWPIKLPGEFSITLYDANRDPIPDHWVQTAKLADPAKWLRL